MSEYDDIKARRAAATDGPWEIEREEDSYPDDDYLGRGLMAPIKIGPWDVDHESRDPSVVEADATFSAHAPADIDWLVERVAKLERVLDQLASEEEAHQIRNALEGDHENR